MAPCPCCPAPAACGFAAAFSPSSTRGGTSGDREDGELGDAKAEFERRRRGTPGVRVGSLGGGPRLWLEVLGTIDDSDVVIAR